MNKMPSGLKIVFFGTSDFAEAILRDLHLSGERLIGIVTRPDKPYGRNLKLAASPVKQYHKDFLSNIPLFQPDKVSTQDFETILKALEPDLFVVAAFGEIIKVNVLNIPRLGSINVHPSLLPKYRGPSPIQTALLNGDQKTGVCIIEVGPKMDAGDIYACEEIEIDLNENFTSLQAKALRKTKDMLLEVVHQKATGSLKSIRQDETEVTFCKKITTADEKINWQDSLIEIHNKIRALSEKPGAWSYLQIGEEVKRVKIYDTEIFTSHVEKLTFNSRKEIVIHKDACFMKIKFLQVEGKKKMDASQFLAGIRSDYFFK